MKFALSTLLSLICLFLNAQNLPSAFYYSDDGKILHRGGATPDGIYNPTDVRTVELTFEQSNYWSQLVNNYQSEIPIEATLTYDGEEIGQVGVRFRGNTSYQMIGNSEKKSFKIEMDFIDEDLNIDGYKNLKFNNAHQDPSFMREVLYGTMASKYTPIAKGNFIHLYLNGEDWGIYPNIQAIDKDFLDEWFLSNDGPLFRATTEGNGGGPGGGGGPNWGDGTAGLNYHDNDTSSYQEYYTLKSSDMENSWEQLVDACFALDIANEDNTDNTEFYFDVDEILWYLAVENIFIDDDSYVYKGKMDYMVYLEPETGRLNGIEYDGNSSFHLDDATSNSWGPFKNVNNPNYPLLNKLLNIPQYRQRYLAHYRTMLHETFTYANATQIIDEMDEQIGDLVAADTKKLYTTGQYINSIPQLKNFITNRRNFLLGFSEVAQAGPTINNVDFFNSEMELDEAPSSEEVAYIRADVSSEEGIHSVNLYYGTGIMGRFTKVSMFDDGTHNDGQANDGIYGGEIPGFPPATLVRYYIEAVSNNNANSVSYMPEGAEHDVFVYRVQFTTNGNGVVINELMASNAATVADEQGSYPDWAEFYNNNDFEVDLSGYYLSDDPVELNKWSFAEGTVIPANGYLIVWVDDDEEDGPLHASFKLSADGEDLILSDPQLNVIDHVAFGAQETDVAYARVPNGTGDFVMQAATFNGNNDEAVAVDNILVQENSISLFPVPAENELNIDFLADIDPTTVSILSNTGQRLISRTTDNDLTIDISQLPAGMYMVQCGNVYKKFIKT
ncbi:MAG: T9SS C-terminal target domain-containing protein [Bacteroidetes bacterium]|nr:MAG: T9SS C-terminal target domain-containing protein [Bacteroidota bacterium]